MPSVLAVVPLAGIDHRIVDTISLVGLILGIFGSLFFTYDLLGRPGGFLRVVLRVSIPAVLGAGVFAGLTLLAFHLLTPAENPIGVLVDVLLFAALGAGVGTFNGLFVDAPSSEVKRRFFFSIKDAIVGFVFVFVYVWLALIIWALALSGPVGAIFSTDNTTFALVVAAVAGIAAGIWRRINRSRHPSSARPKWFSGKGFVIGMSSAVTLCLVALLASFQLAGGGMSTNAVIGAVFLAAASGIPGGGVTGGLSRYLFWWTNSLPPRGLEVIGVMLILLAFLAQVTEPVLGLLNIVPS